MANVFELEHGSIGKLRGVMRDSVVQFLGVKYATIKNKFARSEICQYKKQDIIEATAIGPTTPSMPIGLQLEFSLIQHELPPPELKQSDTECLNLNITIPKPDGKVTGLPVLVFLHGGGYNIGANSWPQYDFAKLVDLSTRLGKPMIGINVNYRLGAPGFLCSKDMLEAGYQENNGLLDQRQALKWIRDNITGFGGDPDQITVIGESAGGVSITFHLQQPEPLFKRAIIMGGTNFLLKPLPFAVIESSYQTVIKNLGIDKLDNASKRVEALINTPSETLIPTIAPNIPLAPVQSGELDLTSITFEKFFSKSANLPGTAWCQNVMIGDCQMDASILAVMLGHKKAGIKDSITKSLNSSLSDIPGAAEAILEAYHISTATSEDEAWLAVLNFGNDLNFYAPTLAYAIGSGITTNVYAFNEKNPWDGPWKGFSSHIFDVAALFMNYDEFLAPEQSQSIISFAEDVIRFASGTTPWAQFEGDGQGAKVKVYGPGNGEDGINSGPRVAVASRGSTRTDRRETIFELLKTTGLTLDRMSQAWTAFMMS